MTKRVFFFLFSPVVLIGCVLAWMLGRLATRCVMRFFWVFFLLPIACFSQSAYTVTFHNLTTCGIYAGAIALNFVDGNQISCFSGSDEIAVGGQMVWTANNGFLAGMACSVYWCTATPASQQTPTTGGNIDFYITDFSNWGGCGYNGAPLPGQSVTNKYASVVCNNSSLPQYYKFGGLSGCSSSISVNGQNGPDTQGIANEWLALQPGECVTVVATESGVSGSIQPPVCQQAPSDGSVYPCGPTLDSQRCVLLCSGDGPYVAGQGDNNQQMQQTTNNIVGAPTNSPPLQDTNLGFSPSQLQFAGGGSTNGSSQGALIAGILTTGFADVMGDLDRANLYQVNDANALDKDMNNGFSNMSSAFRSDTNLSFLTNLGLLNTNQLGATNYPDQAVISNTARILGDADLITSNIIASTDVFSALSNNWWVQNSGMLSQGSNAAAGMAAAVSNEASLMGMIPSDGDGSAGYTQQITRPGGATFSLEVTMQNLLAHGGSAFSVLRTVFAWCICVVLFRYMLIALYDGIDKAIAQTQLEGNKQMALVLGTGANINIVTAAVYAPIVLALIASGPTLLFTVVDSFKAANGVSLTGGVAAFGTLSALPIYSLVSMAVPVDVMTSAGLSYYTFKLIAVPAYKYTVMLITKFMIA